MERPQPQLGTQTETLVPRIAALIVDAVLLAFLISIVTGIGFAIADLLGFLVASASGIFVFAYFIYMEGTYGQTIGKKLLGIVVIKEDGSDCDMTASAIRNVLRIVDGMFLYLVGLVVILVTDDDQRVGDLVGDTYVVSVQQ